MNWEKPAGRGADVTSFVVEFMNKEGKFVATELCGKSDANSCLISMTEFWQKPWLGTDFGKGDRLVAKVAAVNMMG